MFMAFPGDIVISGLICIFDVSRGLKVAKSVALVSGGVHSSLSSTLVSATSVMSWVFLVYPDW